MPRTLQTGAVSSSPGAPANIAQESPINRPSRRFAAGTAPRRFGVARPIPSCSEFDRAGSPRIARPAPRISATEFEVFLPKNSEIHRCLLRIAARICQRDSYRLNRV
jgi:hypothetical protein